MKLKKNYNLYVEDSHNFVTHSCSFPSIAYINEMGLVWLQRMWRNVLFFFEFISSKHWLLLLFFTHKLYICLWWIWRWTGMMNWKQNRKKTHTQHFNSSATCSRLQNTNNYNENNERSVNCKEVKRIHHRMFIYFWMSCVRSVCVCFMIDKQRQRQR